MKVARAAALSCVILTFWAFATNPSDIFFAGFLGFPVAGALILWNRPTNRIGWLLVLIGTLPAPSILSRAYEPFISSLSYATWLFTLTGWGQGLIPFLVALFPTGRLPSSRWRWPSRVAAASLVLVSLVDMVRQNPPEEAGDFNPISLPSLEPLIDIAEPVLGAILIAFGLAALVNAFLRIRTSTGDERQQLKLFAYSSAVFPTLMLVNVLPPGAELHGLFLALAFVVGFNAIAFAIGVAVLRYRLYDIDVVINKTFVYGALAAFITLIYVVVVVGVGSLVGAGGKPNLGLSLAATALVAIAFQPVRERIQRIANRLVYGQRLSPYEAVTSFSHRMAESLSFDEVLPQVAQAAANAVGGERAAATLIFPMAGQEKVFWPADQSQNSFNATVEVVYQGTQVGEISVAKKKGEALTTQEQKLLSDLASQAGLAFSNLRLTEELKAKLVELQESRRRIVSAQDEERRRMERDIHDGAQQQLVSMSVKLGLAKLLMLKDPQKASLLMDGLKADASEAVETLRDLARGLFPPILSERGLVSALRAHIDKMDIPAHLEADSLSRLSPEVETALYFVIREALQNATKYAPGAQIAVLFAHFDGEVTFEVKDRGSGFDPANAKTGSGLQNMKDRIEALGGELVIESHPESGTVVKGRVTAAHLERVE